MKKTALVLLAALAAAVCAAGVLALYTVFPAGALSAGALAVLSVLAAAAFFAELFGGGPDRSAAVLALLTGAAALWQLPAAGQAALPRWLFAVAASPWFGLLPLALTAAYLVLTRGRGYWRAFCAVMAASAAVFGLGVLTLRLTGSGLPGLRDCLAGACGYAAAVCCALAAADTLRERAALRREVRALAARQELLTENCRSMARSIKDTSVMRHDRKNQIASLRLLAGMGDPERLEQTLVKLSARLDKLSLREFSRNFMVNAILQNAADRAMDAGIQFSALAPVPEELDIGDGDLCSLLRNMLDAALVWASGAPEGSREIALRLRPNQGFLAVKCDSACGPGGGPEDSGTDACLRAARRAAEKYGGVLDVSRASGRITVQTALNMQNQ